MQPPPLIVPQSYTLNYPPTHYDSASPSSSHSPHSLAPLHFPLHFVRSYPPRTPGVTPSLLRKSYSSIYPQVRCGWGRCLYARFLRRHGQCGMRIGIRAGVQFRGSCRCRGGFSSWGAGRGSQCWRRRRARWRRLRHLGRLRDLRGRFHRQCRGCRLGRCLRRLHGRGKRVVRWPYRRRLVVV